jgi:hypothetical protein
MTDLSVMCPDCLKDIPLGVCRSAAGFYIGYFCNACGPYDRVSGYYDMEEGAASVLSRLRAAIDKL